MTSVSARTETSHIHAHHIARAHWRWHVRDIMLASVIGVACGVIYWAWDAMCSVPLLIFSGITPGFEGIFNGIWLLAGPLAALMVRKPGAALYAETLAAFLELTLGNQWGVGASLIVGILQGLGAEIAFALFIYRLWNLATAALSGTFAAIMCAAYYWFANPGWGMIRASVYAGTSIASGVLAGILCWLLVRKIKQTGALA